MNEFDFIATYLAPLAGPGGLGLIDDAAILTPNAGKDLILTKDSMVEGIHFPEGHYGGDSAEKLLRVNLSDLAAKGARPVGYLLSIAWPRGIDDAYFKGFAAGLKQVQEAYSFSLLGGDTVSTTGPMVITATMIGEVPKGDMVRRSGARIGDDVWVTGTIGDAFLGLQSVLGHKLSPIPSADALLHFEEAYFYPEPRLLFRKTLREYASACADVSDGLIADIGHIAKASSIGITIEGDKVPLSSHSQIWRDEQADSTAALKRLIIHGDDYELGFTVPEENRAAIETAAKIIGLQVSRIGKVEKGEGVTVTINGETIDIEKTGHTHF